MGPRLRAFVAIVLWGLSFVATRLALREVPPVTLVVARFGIGAALLLGVLALRRQHLVPPRSSWPALLLMGFVGLFVHQLLQSHALTMTTAVRTGWLIGLTPIWAALLAALFLGERFGPAKLAGLAVGFAGAIVVVTRGQFTRESLALPSTPGDLLILASTLNWALYTVLSVRTLRRLGSLPATAAAMALGWAMLLPLFVAQRGWRPLAHVSPRGWGAIVFLGVGCSGLAYWLWCSALERIEASRVAAFLYLEPLVTLAAAVPLLGEPVGIPTLAGGALVLAGVAITQRAPRAGPG